MGGYLSAAHHARAERLVGNRSRGVVHVDKQGAEARRGAQGVARVDRVDHQANAREWREQGELRGGERAQEPLI